MLRTAIVRAARQASIRTARPAFVRPAILPISNAVPRAIAASSIRCYSASAGLKQEEIEGRILDLLKKFDKVGCLW